VYNLTIKRAINGWVITDKIVNQSGIYRADGTKVSGHDIAMSKASVKAFIKSHDLHPFDLAVWNKGYNHIVQVTSYPADGKVFCRQIPALAATAIWIPEEELTLTSKYRYVAYGIAECKSPLGGEFPVDMIRYLGNGGFIYDDAHMVFRCGMSRARAQDFVEERWNSFGWTVKGIHVRDLKE
jgi:hypothetical protein